jgi:hypothetical protein
MNESRDEANEDSDQAFAMVQEADLGDLVAVLKAREPGATRIVVLSAVKGHSACLVIDAETRRNAFGGRVPRGIPTDKARAAELIGAKLVGRGPRHLSLVLSTGKNARLDARGGRVTLMRDAEPLEGETPLTSPDAVTLEAYAAEARLHLPALAELGLTLRRDALIKAIARARTRLERRATAIEGDLERISATEALAAKAAWLLPAAKSAKRGQTSLEVVDWSTGEPVPLIVPLDPAKPASLQIEAIFRKAKRLKIGREVAERRLSDTYEAVFALTSAAEAIRNADTAEAVEALARDAKKVAPRDLVLPEAGTLASTRHGRRTSPEERKPFRTFLSTRGVPLLVGRGPEDNDALTFRVSSPHDLWVHAKEKRGAHVIVPLKKGKSPPEGALVEAAHLAAHFSDARDEAVVDVQYTPRKYVKKPRGAAKGFVVVEREKVLVLRLDRGLVTSLLDREELG